MKDDHFFIPNYLIGVKHIGLDDQDAVWTTYEDLVLLLAQDPLHGALEDNIHLLLRMSLRWAGETRLHVAKAQTQSLDSDIHSFDTRERAGSLELFGLGKEAYHSFFPNLTDSDK